MLSIARYTVRKNLKGQVLEEKVEILPDDPRVELAFLGKLYARQLSADPRFQAYCEEYQKGGEMGGRRHG